VCVCDAILGPYGVRHEKTMGLIAAKKSGGDAALGDVIVFFDCHVKPRDGWEEAFLKRTAVCQATFFAFFLVLPGPGSWDNRDNLGFKVPGGI